MGSLDDSTAVIGQYNLPVIGPTTKNSDPWKRNYFMPPALEPFIPRRFPLKDVRPLLSEPDYSPLKLLQSHGFGVVKHKSDFVSQLGEDMHEDAVSEIYLLEVEKLVLETLGAKKLFNITTVLRQGKSEPEEFRLPTSLPVTARAKIGIKTQDNPDDKTEDAFRGGNQMPKLARSTPLRVPHQDYTPLGARQTIRWYSEAILDVAKESGVIAAEDGICEAVSVDPTTGDSNDIVAEQYNQNGELGPRYALYSIWRPLKKVGRDPITLAPRKEAPEDPADGLVHWPYLNRVPGFKGDALRELAMLGIRSGYESINSKSTEVEWCYVSGLMPDEVLFIKLFDSASLGAESRHAGGPWHASPEIFDAAGSDEPRESLECRVVVFW